jgi:voltage-gated sodium channel
MFLFFNNKANKISKKDNEEHQNEVEELALSKLREQRETEKIRLDIKHEKLNYLNLSTPLREYVFLSNYVDAVVFHPIFSNWILIATVVAGIIVGLQTYPTFDDNEYVVLIDTIVLYSFSLEVILKLIAEGTSPHHYFVGSEWRWNWFDFLIVLFSLPFFPIGGGQVKLLRLVRLMRLAKVFRKVPQLQMIMMGLIGGLKSIVYIVILLLITFYLFAIAGIIFFRDNDPWHFKSVEIAMLTLLRVATLDDWGNILYINYFGCEDYPADYYTNDPEEGLNKLGSLTYCGNSQAKPIVSTIYFLAFIVICTFCILSLFIGAVSMSMSESMEVMKLEKEVGRVVKEKLRMGEVEKEYLSKDKLDRKTQRKIKILELAFSGQELFDHKIEHVIDWTSIPSIYKSMTIQCQDLSEFSKFQNFITWTIVLAGVTVGLNTDRKVSEKYFNEIEVLDSFVQYIFLSELLVKVCAEGTKPYKYFYDSWNIFDFIVVVGSFIPTGSGNLVTILRLMRLLRVLKLMRALPQLQVIVSALMKGMGSIGFISVILFMFFFLSGVVAMTLFQENDPVNFGTLHMTILILFLSSTLDNWSNFLYTNLYGCEQFGYDDYPGKCDPNAPFSFFWTSIFWVIFILIGGLVLLTLFIGVVTMGMEDAKKEQIEEDRIFQKAESVGVLQNISHESMTLYKEVFDVIDFTTSNKIGRDEMHFGLKIAGIFLSQDDFLELWEKVDDDGSNALDFSEFLEFMFDLRNQIKIMEEGVIDTVHDGGVIPESFAKSVKKRKDTLLYGVGGDGFDSENSLVVDANHNVNIIDKKEKETVIKKDDTEERINTSITLLLNVPKSETNLVSSAKLKINDSIDKIANEIVSKESPHSAFRNNSRRSGQWDLSKQEVVNEATLFKVLIIKKNIIILY